MADGRSQVYFVDLQTETSSWHDPRANATATDLRAWLQRDLAKYITSAVEGLSRLALLPATPGTRRHVDLARRTPSHGHTA